jgi:uncharacterized protein YecE (DUF72 family)
VPDQLDLFGEGNAQPSNGRKADGWPTKGSPLEQRYERYRILAASLPSELRMGTSSWSFPGWQGIVYSRKRGTAHLAREGLSEYTQHPLLRTVGIDRSYYAPIPPDDLRGYADQLPDGFECCVKAPAAVTSPVQTGFGRHAANPDYLSVTRLSADLIDPLAADFSGHTGPLILQFSPPGRGRRESPDKFVEDLDRFLEGVGRRCRCAVEIRDKWVLTDAYRRVLARHGAAHVYNYWSAMPMPGAQARFIPPEEQPFVMTRLLLRPGTWYEEQREVFAPFDRIAAPDDAMRRDVLGIVRRAAAVGRRTYLLVNNKAEGSAPLTIEALAERFVVEQTNGR